MAMAMRGEEAAPMTPEQRPDLFAVRQRQGQACESVFGKELEAPFAMGRRPDLEPTCDLEEEHEPVFLPPVAVFTDEAGQMEVGGLQGQAQFLGGFATGASVGRFAQFRAQLAARRTPKAAVRFLGPLEQQDFILTV